jgi:hypothetical protein
MKIFLLLKKIIVNFSLDVMTKNGFSSYPKEWWHYTLIDEPFPTTYFDFIINK